ncbi:uncharacterized protein LOC126735393 [Anthonomus grandis grandis]|uniref:uncharacterized protein LOC126735393 n=1 Tax=Anthonomus grandis grandis TaxID=2921223 RepID=UPI002166BBE4|nr:uncharacterized protein LOC126735393 [Anthonomus grandis grandis]
MEQGEASTSREPPPKKVKKHLTMGEHAMVKTVYESIRAQNPDLCAEDAANFCGSLTKLCPRTVFRSLKVNNKKQKKETRGRKKIVLEDDIKYILRRKVHSFFFRNEMPTLKKIKAEVDDDDSLTKISLGVLKRTLRGLNFRYLKRNRKSFLIEKDDIVLWRRKFLKQIRDHRLKGNKIYYTDETWLNEGHTRSKVWQDLNVTSSRQAFLDGLSTGLKCPSGKGRRLIITHIGSNSGFLDGGLNVFESKKSGDYHQDMNSDVFEKWFSSVLRLVEPGSVIVIDNAPYHSRRVEKLPTSAWQKADIIDWIKSKDIQFDENLLKVQLLDIVRVHKDRYIKYVVDEMAHKCGVTLLRLPPYHCELNPIELIWAQIKGEVARKNTTFKLNDVKLLLSEAINGVTADDWKKCIGHVIKEEQKMWDLDTQAEVMVEPLIITPGFESSDSDDSWTASDSE